MLISPYILVFILLLVCFLLSRAIPTLNNKLYFVMFAVLTVFLAFRYGQGTDYSMYEWFYLSAPEDLDLSDAFFSDAYHTEIGWKIMMSILQMLGIPFEAFIAVLSLFMMYCLNRCIALFSCDKMLSLLIAFPTLYLIGFFSMLRQAMVVAVFLGFLLKWIIYRQNKLLYLIVSVALLSIHTVSMVFILAMLVIKFFDSSRDRSWLFLFFGICLIIGLLPLAIGGLRSFMSTLPFVGVYYREVSISWMAVLERTTWFLIIVPFGYKLLSDEAFARRNELSTLLSLYVFGISLYFLFSISPNVASRFFFPFESLELILVPLVFSGVRRWKNAVVVLVICLAIVFVVKNINASIDERGYYSFVTWQNYPYVSIFENHGELSNYRIPYHYSGMP